MTVAEQLEAILAEYQGKPHEVIPILQATQDAFGYLPEQEMKDIARFLRVAESHVYGVATFYEQFKFTPRGRNMITVCRGTACHVRGGQRIREELERRLGIKTSETTPDLEYTLETAACIGCCGLAPAIVINETTYGRLTPAKVVKILEERKGADE
jgi:NADH:ubiquinone oxidoreductase subunit E